MLLLQKEEIACKAYFDFTRRLLQWRKGNTALSEGKLTQFTVQNGVYVYARTSKERHVVVIINGKKEARTLNLTHYSEVFPSKTAYDVFSQQPTSWDKELTLEPRGVMILDFSK